MGSPDSNPLPLERISQITGVPTGVSTSDFQNGLYGSTSMINLYRVYGLNPELRAAWLKDGRDKSGVSENRNNRRFDRLKRTVLDYGGRILSKAENECSCREVLGWTYPAINHDLDVLEEVATERNGAAYIEGLEEVADRALHSNMITLNYANQYAGLSNEEVRTDLPQRRFEALQARLEGRLDLLPLPSAETDYFGFADQVKALGGSGLRVSTEWGKLFTEKGKADPGAFKKLADLIRHCREPEVNMSIRLMLHHFTFPDLPEYALDDPGIAKLMGDTTSEVVSRLAEMDALPDGFLTLNEPVTEIVAGFIDGKWPPHKPSNPVLTGLYSLGWDFLKTKGGRDFVAAMDNSVEAHFAMYDAIQAAAPGIPVGLTLNMPTYDPLGRNPLDKLIIEAIHMVNRSWLERFLHHPRSKDKFQADEIDLQYYNKFDIGLLRQTLNDTAYAMDLKLTEDHWHNGWKSNPAGGFIRLLELSDMLMQSPAGRKSLVLPKIAIGETGVASLLDPIDALAVMAEAFKQGMNLIPNEVPYLNVWTLRDNSVEWRSGMTPKFGLLGADGNPKPRGCKEPKPLNLARPDVLLALGKHIRTLSQRAANLMQMPIDDPREIARCENQLENIAVKLKLSKDLEKRLLNF